MRLSNIYQINIDRKDGNKAKRMENEMEDYAE